MKVRRSYASNRNVIIEMNMRDFESLYGMILPISKNETFSQKIPMLLDLKNACEEFLKAELPEVAEALDALNKAIDESSEV